MPETPDVANVERDFLAQGYDLIFATAFGYQPFTQEVAKENPDQHFFGITPTVAPADNILNYYGELWDGRYLTGLVAGSMTKSNVIGFVAAQPIPTVIAGLNAFTLGVREVNPDAEVRVIWTLSWFDPPAEKQAAVALVEAGADVIAQHQDTPSSVQGAAEKGAWAIGSESDMTAFAPDKYLTGTVWNWCPFYLQAVEMVQNGAFAARRILRRPEGRHGVARPDQCRGARRRAADGREEEAGADRRHVRLLAGAAQGQSGQRGGRRRQHLEHRRHQRHGLAGRRRRWQDP